MPEVDRLLKSYPDLDGIVPSLVDAQLFLRFLWVHRHLQLIEQSHIPAIIIQRINPCSSTKVLLDTDIMNCNVITQSESLPAFAC